MSKNYNELSEKFKAYCDEEQCFNFFADFSYEDLKILNAYLNLFYCYPFDEDDFEVLGEFLTKSYNEFYEFLTTMWRKSAGVEIVTFSKEEIDAFLGDESDFD